MTRGIKFRAWDRDRKMFHGGNVSNLIMGLGGGLFWQFGFNEPSLLDEESTSQFAVEQFTGLHDKDGAEIYEGDIVKHFTMRGSLICQIIYQAPNYVMKTNPKNRAWYQFLREASKNQYEQVIGNIHENPELIEEAPGGETGGDDSKGVL